MLTKIDLASVPPIAVAVTIAWHFHGPAGEAFLFRSLADPDPLRLHPPGGSVVVELVEPQALWLQILDGSDPLLVSTIGFRLP